MPDEKRIERGTIYSSALIRQDESTADLGPWIRYEGHLDALGGAEKARDWQRDGWDKCTEMRLETLRRAEAAEENLETLRSDIAYVRGHLEGYANAIELPGFGVDVIGGRKQTLIDALREDAERLSQSGRES